MHTMETPTPAPKTRIKRIEGMDKERKLLHFFKFKDAEDLETRWPEDRVGPYTKEQGVFTWRDLVVVPQDMVFLIIDKEWRDLPSRMGGGKFFSMLLTKYIGISNSQVRRFLSQDPEHTQWLQRRGTARVASVVPRFPGSIISIDHTDLNRSGDKVSKQSGNGQQALLVMVDAFSGFTWAKLVYNKKVSTTAAAVDDWLSETKVQCKTLRADNGFRGPELQAVAEKHGVKVIFGLPSNPVSQRWVEGRNRTVKEYLYSSLDKVKTQEKGGYIAVALRKAIHALNHSVNSANGYMPVDVFSHDLPKNVLRRIRINLGQGRTSGFNQKYNSQLEPGDFVRVDRTAIDNAVRAKFKSGSLKASHQPSFSKELYSVIRHTQDNMVALKGVDHLVLRGQVVKVIVPEDSDKFVREYSALSEKERRRAEAWKEAQLQWKRQVKTEDMDVEDA